jgi:hypothetical protein
MVAFRDSAGNPQVSPFRGKRTAEAQRAAELASAGHCRPRLAWRVKKSGRRTRQPLERAKGGEVIAVATHGSRPDGWLPSETLFFVVVVVVVVHELVVVAFVVIFF